MIRNGGPEGPGFWELDTLALQALRVGEKRYAEIHVDMYNTTNSVRWGNPNTGFSANAGNTFGQISGTTGGQRTMRFGFEVRVLSKFPVTSNQFPWIKKRLLRKWSRRFLRVVGSRIWIPERSLSDQFTSSTSCGLAWLLDRLPAASGYHLGFGRRHASLVEENGAGTGGRKGTQAAEPGRNRHRGRVVGGFRDHTVAVGRARRRGGRCRHRDGVAALDRRIDRQVWRNERRACCRGTASQVSPGAARTHPCPRPPHSCSLRCSAPATNRSRPTRWRFVAPAASPEPR